MDANMFVYCGNNPVVRVDACGDFWDTVFDVVSLAFSVAEVVANPTDPWAWAGLVGDAIDLIPFVSGVGEVTRVVKTAVKATDAISDVAKITDNVYDTTKTIFKATNKVAETADTVSDAKKAVSATERASAVRKAWKNELINVENGGSGISRAWTNAEKAELLSNGKIKGYQGHHMKSVKGYPGLAGDPNNIQFLTRSEHLNAHRGNWRNITHGRYIP